MKTFTLGQPKQLRGGPVALRNAPPPTTTALKPVRAAKGAERVGRFLAAVAAVDGLGDAPTHDLVVYFPIREAKDEFLRRTGLWSHGDKYIEPDVFRSALQARDFRPPAPRKPQERQNAYRQQQAAFELATDTEFWFAVMFASAEDRDAFIASESASLPPVTDGRCRGLDLAAQIGLALETPLPKFAPPKTPNAKLMASAL